MRARAAITLQEKRAEWLGAPVNPEAELEVQDLLGSGSSTTRRTLSRDMPRLSQRALDALITPRGAHVPRLAQAGKDPRRWLGHLQPGFLTARERRLQLDENAKGQPQFFLTGSDSLESIDSRGA